jgi:hypothetical protein
MGNATVDCKNIVVGSASQVLIGAVGSPKTSARDLGATNGDVTLSIAATKNDVVIDQALGAIRSVITSVERTVSIPLSEITLENLGLIFDTVAPPATNVLTVDQSGERYFKLWIIIDGILDSNGVAVDREIVIERFASSGSGDLTNTKGTQATITLTGKALYDCDGASGLTITDTSKA